MTPDIADSLIDNAAVVTGLAVEYKHCFEDPRGYAWEQRITKPHTSTWTEWREATLQQLVYDLELRVERMHTLTTARVS